jgi:hypothetical protein
VVLDSSSILIKERRIIIKLHSTSNIFLSLVLFQDLNGGMKKKFTRLEILLSRKLELSILVLPSSLLDTPCDHSMR